MGEIAASMELENTDDCGIVSEGLRDESTVAFERSYQEAA